MLKESCIDVSDAISCNAAALFCEREISVPFFSTGMPRHSTADAHALKLRR